MMDKATTPFRKHLLVILTCILLPGVSVFLTANRTSTGEASPVSDLEIRGLKVRQSTIDVGIVWSGGQGIEKTFFLENRTGQAVNVDSVTSDCGCTVPSAKSGNFESGRSIEIPVTFWPPKVVDEGSGLFKRTITVTVDLAGKRESIPLYLTGSIEPDSSLSVFPLNSEVDDSYLTTRVAATIHVKGSAALVDRIPNRLLISPGSNQRIVVGAPAQSAQSKIIAKDIEVGLARTPDQNQDWTSVVKFAADQSSDGLTIHFHGRVPNRAIATPQSLILVDDGEGREAVVYFRASDGTCPRIVSAIASQLLVCKISDSSSASYSQMISVRLSRHLSCNKCDTVIVQARGSDGTLQTISIPVVLIRGGERHP
jgi:hypothetical protein